MQSKRNVSEDPSRKERRIEVHKGFSWRESLGGVVGKAKQARQTLLCVDGWRSQGESVKRAEQAKRVEMWGRIVGGCVQKPKSQEFDKQWF